MMTALIDELLAGDDDDQGDPDMVFLWLTDDPELNRQSEAKMLATSGVLTAFNTKVIKPEVDAPTFEKGMVYFLNMQKLGSATSYVKVGDGRHYTLWQMVANTVAEMGTRFIVVVNEGTSRCTWEGCHRGRDHHAEVHSGELGPVGWLSRSSSGCVRHPRIFRAPLQRH